jgi:GTP-binding protein LepA
MNIRNFSIIAHIDHGKSTLADRMLEETKTVEDRKMKDQVLDSMDLERERGITIKMQPVRMHYEHAGEAYEFNLIDTPGHIDFSYEVSRALKAVEGVLLLVDSTQGVQAQTLTTLQMAKDLGLTIIPVLTKTDVPHSRPDEVGEEVMRLLDCEQEEILLVSGKTGDGVPALLEAIRERIPAPAPASIETYRGLIFDFQYDNHRGIIVFMRVFDGQVKKGDVLKFSVSGRSFTALEVGVVKPEETPVDSLGAGEIGYIVTGIKEPGVANVGDTLVPDKSTAEALSGYQEAHPVVWSSVFPENQDDFTAPPSTRSTTAV